MSQKTTLTLTMVQSLLDVMTKTKRPAVIDWVNRTIRVLSDEKVDSEILLSTGPLRWQDVLFEISGTCAGDKNHGKAQQ